MVSITVCSNFMGACEASGFGICLLTLKQFSLQIIKVLVSRVGYGVPAGVEENNRKTKQYLLHRLCTNVVRNWL
jgi:hypothetical protein